MASMLQALTLDLAGKSPCKTAERPHERLNTFLTSISPVLIIQTIKPEPQCWHENKKVFHSASNGGDKRRKKRDSGAD
jgi:hypothetical protein